MPPPERRVVLDDREETNHIADVRSRERTLEITRSLGEIDLENLSREVREIGGHSIWWGVLAAQGAADHERACDHLKIVEATAGNQLRFEHQRAGDKFTVDSIRDEVMLTDTAKAARMAVIDTKERADILRAVSYSIGGKQRTLESLSANIGREILASSPLGDRVRDNRDAMPSGGRTRRQRAE